MTPKFKVGDILITTGPGKAAGKIITVTHIEVEGEEFCYYYESEWTSCWTEKHLRKYTPLDKLL